MGINKGEMIIEVLKPIEAWFQLKGWIPSPFQMESWEAYLQGENGLIQVPTGSGKTLAAVMGPIARILSDQQDKNGIQLYTSHL